MRLNLIDKIYVCHYTKLVERVDILNTELSKYSLEVDWITQYDKEDINIQETKSKMINIDKPLGLGGIHDQRNLRMSELSLILKHNHAFEDIIKNNYKYALILEDDVVFSDNFVNKFNKMISFDNDFDLIWIGTCCDLKSDNILSDKYIYEQKGSRCTHAYIISNKCAKKMIDFLKFNNYPMDFAFNRAILEYNLKNYWLEPALVFQNQLFETSIQKDNNFI